MGKQTAPGAEISGILVDSFFVGFSNPKYFHAVCHSLSLDGQRVRIQEITCPDPQDITRLTTLALTMMDENQPMTEPKIKLAKKQKKKDDTATSKEKRKRFFYEKKPIRLEEIVKNTPRLVFIKARMFFVFCFITDKI